MKKPIVDWNESRELLTAWDVLFYELYPQDSGRYADVTPQRIDQCDLIFNEKYNGKWIDEGNKQKFQFNTKEDHLLFLLMWNA